MKSGSEDSSGIDPGVRVPANTEEGVQPEKPHRLPSRSARPVQGRYFVFVTVDIGSRKIKSTLADDGVKTPKGMTNGASHSLRDVD